MIRFPDCHDPHLNLVSLILIWFWSGFGFRSLLLVLFSVLDILSHWLWGFWPCLPFPFGIVNIVFWTLDWLLVLGYWIWDSQIWFLDCGLYVCRDTTLPHFWPSEKFKSSPLFLLSYLKLLSLVDLVWRHLVDGRLITSTFSWRPSCYSSYYTTFLLPLSIIKAF